MCLYGISNKGTHADGKNLLNLGPRVRHSTCKLFVFQDDCLLSLVEVLEYLSASTYCHFLITMCNVSKLFFKVIKFILK